MLWLAHRPQFGRRGALVTNGKNAQAIVALVDTAMASTGEQSAEAAVMLLDATLALALTRLGDGADEMVGWMAEYLVKQFSHVTGGAGHA
jgi:hypothetical protein